MSRALPRHRPAPVALSGAGMPGDRMARIAARRAFVNLKQACMAAVAALPGPRAEWLRLQIRHAAEPADLWLLRAAMFDALPRHDFGAERDTLQHGIESVFPGGPGVGGIASLS